MSLVIGIDVGASHTEAAIAADAANPIARVRGPGIVVKLGEVDQAVEAITDTVSAVKRKCLGEAPVDSIVVGSTGVHDEGLRSAMERMLRDTCCCTKVQVTTDGAIALEDAFGDCPGIVICAGSGSIAYARDPSNTIHRVGGLGPVLADEGSGYAIGRAGLRAAARVVDGRLLANSFADSIMSAIGVCRLDEMINWAWSADRPAVSALARVVCRAASEGDGTAIGIVNVAADDLAHLAVSLAHYFSEEEQVDIAFSGGVLSLESPVRAALKNCLSTRLQRSRFIETAVDPALGALAMATRLAAR